MLSTIFYLDLKIFILTKPTGKAASYPLTQYLFPKAVKKRSFFLTLSCFFDQPMLIFA